jgi:hypothetical protein
MAQNYKYILFSASNLLLVVWSSYLSNKFILDTGGMPIFIYKSYFAIIVFAICIATLFFCIKSQKICISISLISYAYLTLFLIKFLLYVNGILMELGAER